MYTQIPQYFKRLQGAWLTSLLVIGLSLIVLMLTMGFTTWRPIAHHPVPAPWNLSTPLPTPTAAYAFAQCADEKFYIIGGRDSTSNPLNNVWMFDSDNITWKSLASLPTPLIGAAATCYNGKIYVMGGKTLDGRMVSSLLVYDINANTWSSSPGLDAIEPVLPLATWGSALGAWNGKLYLVGGSEIGFTRPMASVSVYDIGKQSWVMAGQIPCFVLSAKGQLSCATSFPGWAQSEQYLYVVGGYSGNAGKNVAYTMRLDMADLSWQAGPAFQSARAAFALAATSTQLYAVGGDANGGTFYDPTIQVESLNLSQWPGGAWTTDNVSQLPLPLLFNSAGFHHSGPINHEMIWSVGGLRQAGPGLSVVDYFLFTMPW